SHAGKPHAIEGEHRNVVERAALAAVRGEVAPRGVLLRHEQIAHFVIVARGAAQPDDVPGVLDVGLLAAEEHGAIDRIAFRIPARLIRGFEDRRMPAHPGGVGAAAGKSPFAGDAVTAVDDDGLGYSRGRPPPEQRVGCPKHLVCNFWVEKSGRVRARGRLCKTPGRACIRGRDRLDNLLEGERTGGGWLPGVPRIRALRGEPRAGRAACVRKWSAISAKARTLEMAHRRPPQGRRAASCERSRRAIIALAWLSKKSSLCMGHLLLTSRA